VPPEIVIGALDVGRRAAVALVLVGRLDAPLRELLGFLVGDSRLVGELARALERRELCEIPGRLQVRMAVGGARHPRLLRLRGERDGPQQEDAERERTHGAAPFELGTQRPQRPQRTAIVVLATVAGLQVYARIVSGADNSAIPSDDERPGVADARKNYEQYVALRADARTDRPAGHRRARGWARVRGDRVGRGASRSETRLDCARLRTSHTRVPGSRSHLTAGVGAGQRRAADV